MWQTLINDGSKAVIDKFKALTSTTDFKNGDWTDAGVTGIFGKWFNKDLPSGDFSQFSAQFLDVCALFVFVFTLLFMKISNIFVKIRSKQEDEIEGLDVPEMCVEAYPDFQTTGRTSPKID